MYVHPVMFGICGFIVAAMLIFIIAVIIYGMYRK